MRKMYFARILCAAFFMTLLGSSAIAQKQDNNNNNLFLITNDDGDLYGFINSKGTVIVEPKYMLVKEFSEGMAAVILNDQELWGFINHTGKMVIPAKYSEVGNFSEGVALVEQDGKWLLIDKNGKTVAKCNELDDYGFITILDFNEGMGDFHDGMAMFNAEGKYGFINKQGKIAIRPSFDYAMNFKNGLAFVGLETENEDATIYRIGYIDKKGNFVWSYTQREEKYDELDDYYDTIPIEELIHEVSIPDEYVTIIPDVQFGEEDDMDNIFVVVEKDPEFPGGMEALYKFLNENLQYPKQAMENNISGKVYVTFVVEKDGSISNIRVLRDIGGGCGDEAVRIIKSMPKWIPGEQRNKPVRVQFTLPIQFQLQ